MTNVDDALQAALQPLFPDRVFPNRYTGDALEYVTTNQTTIPEVHAESVGRAARYLVQVHYYCPNKYNPNPAKISISQALILAGFTTPTITPAHENEGQHWVLECEFANGGAWYGQT